MVLRTRPSFLCAYRSFALFTSFPTRSHEAYFLPSSTAPCCVEQTTPKGNCPCFPVCRGTNREQFQISTAHSKSPTSASAVCASKYVSSEHVNVRFCSPSDTVIVFRPASGSERAVEIGALSPFRAHRLPMRSLRPPRTRAISVSIRPRLPSTTVMSGTPPPPWSRKAPTEAKRPRIFSLRAARARATWQAAA